MGGAIFAGKIKEMKLYSFSSAIVLTMLLLCGCDKLSDLKPYSINITDASCLYKRSKVATKSGATGGSSDSEGWFKIDADGNEVPISVYGKNDQEIEWNIRSIHKIGSRTLLVNDMWFADMQTGHMYDSEISVSSGNADFPPHFAEYSGKLYYSNHDGLYEINPVDYSYIKMLPDGQVSSYCVVDKDGMCVYVESGDSRIKLPSGRIIKVDGMEVSDVIYEKVYSDLGINKYDWFEYDGHIYRLMCCYLESSVAEALTGQVNLGFDLRPFVAGIYKYTLNGNSVDVERVCAYMDVWGQSGHLNEPSLFVRKKNDKLCILKYDNTYDAGVYMLEFDGENITRGGLARGVNLRKIVESVGMMDLRCGSGPNDTMHYARKTVIVESDPVFFCEDVIYKLNTSDFLIEQRPLNFQNEYDVYSLKQTDGSNTAQFTGMRFYDGAIVLGDIDENGNVTIIDETSSSYKYSYMQKIN